MHFCKIKTLQNYKRMEWKLLTPRHKDARPLPGNSFLPPRCCQWCANRLLHERLGKAVGHCRHFCHFLSRTSQSEAGGRHENFLLCTKEQEKGFSSIYIYWLGIVWSLTDPKCSHTKRQCQWQQRIWLCWKTWQSGLTCQQLKVLGGPLMLSC